MLMSYCLVIAVIVLLALVSFFSDRKCNVLKHNNMFALFIYLHLNLNCKFSSTVSIVLSFRGTVYVSATAIIILIVIPLTDHRF